MLVYGLQLANGASIENMAVAGGASLPVTPIAGQLFFLTTDSSMYLYDGAAWVVLGTGGSSTNNFVTIPFSYNSSTPVNILMMAANMLIYDCSIIIETAFNDPTSTLSVGDSGNPSRLMSSVDNSSTIENTYKTTPSHKYGSNTQVTLTITPGTSTQGSGYVVLTIQV